ncbi:hypothetical protein [Pseudoduganella chitinolytica]|uniref:Uncharacterized protein n=1 Tax=Pseudoduganella chitinolytica TaxID=34070 RepID=A0ABY8BEW8_9BURK|nr:hypothetical protein [Pseudoduganella chitinolytica]WEF33953.1 hypothetical protein PX653_04020 [Pseudoduganella chitinolytica]
MTAATPTERRATQATGTAQAQRARVLPLLFPFLLVVAALVVDGLLFYRANRVPTAVPIGIALALLILLTLKYFWAGGWPRPRAAWWPGRRWRRST